jgi:glycosyltransferase involved in cell wall biosynthesis
VPLAKAAYAAAYAHQLAHVLEGRRFDHVLAYWGNYAASAAYLFHAATQPDVPFSMIVHARMDLYRHRAYLAQKLQYADNIFVVCEYNRGYLREHYPGVYPLIADRVHVHHLGMPLDTVHFEPDGRRPAQLLSVGHLEPLKGFANLITAFAALPAGACPPLLDLIGGGPDEPALRRLAARLGVTDRVRFRGWLPPDAVLDEMRHATLLVHPSIAPDAMPTVVKEAMAVGTPVVASDLAGIPEMLDAGRCGVLVAPGDVAGLTSAIGSLLADPDRRRALAIAGRAHMERRFDLWRNGRALAERLRATTRRPA